MFNDKIYFERIKMFAEEVSQKRYFNKIDLDAEYIYDKINPIKFEDIGKYDFKKIKKGEEWGKLWGCGWFKFTGKIPKSFENLESAVLIDINGEACVFVNGVPDQGLTNKIDWDHNSGKYFYPLFKKSHPEEKVEILIESGANGLFGKSNNKFSLKQCELVCVNRKAVKLDYDLKILINLYESLEENTPRKRKILRELNIAVNLWNNGKGIEECLEITQNLLSKPANASALTMYSIGHAHIDLGWLWPIRETKRKASRTFSTVLKLMEEYPQYKFGASQPQLYEWVKENYPKLYEKIKIKIKEKRWECQGGMWVEPDMNIPGGESLVRQCFYGKKFFKDEFDVEVKNLWLPDVFGYSAALPQILKKCDIDYFLTQKISWNEFNTFPYHTFYWEGIDGTELLTHFLPTNEYNFANMPKAMIESEKRYSQSDVSDEFLNLFGVGDGGGGPSRTHIEFGKRLQNLEGVPKFKFAFAKDFFEKISEIPKDDLPKWKGELYLELHRGTYTTHALMKKYNRLLELKLRDIEFLGTFIKNYPKQIIERIWKDTLLNQFHDILPGSSIEWVYRDAHKLSENNLEKLSDMQNNFLNEIHKIDNKDELCGSYIAYNTLSWERQELVRFEIKDDSDYIVLDYNNEKITATINDKKLEFLIKVPPMGYTSFKIEKSEKVKNTGNKILREEDDAYIFESDLMKVKIGKDGFVYSLFDKEFGLETIREKANLLTLWEDKPRNWEAWDINHYYRQTKPEFAEIVSQKILSNSENLAILEQKFKIGKSKITQKVKFNNFTKQIIFENIVDWKEEKKMLRVSAATNIQSELATFEIQYGIIQRPTHSNTSWDYAKFETIGHRFADLSSQNYGISLINDCKYGYYVKDNILDLNLLRSPKSPDETADIHIHNFSFGYTIHKGNFYESDTLKKAHELNSKLIIQKIKKLPEKKKMSFAKLSDDRHIKIETIKPAENGNGLVVRLYETSGGFAKTNLILDRNYIRCFDANLLEIKQSKLDISDKTISLSFTPFEIKTLILE